MALFTDPEEIYIMKRSGDVVAYDANLRTETVKIPNEENYVMIHPATTVGGGSVAGPSAGGSNGGAAAAAAGGSGAGSGANNQQGGVAAAGAAAAAAAAAGAAASVPMANVGLHEYQLFVNRKEQICVMQSASEVPQGRNIKVRIRTAIVLKSYAAY